MLKVFSAEGVELGSHPFKDGTPVKDDCFLLNGDLVFVVSRRWTHEGNLELIVDFD